MDFLVIEDNIITNIVVAEPDIAEELGFLPWYDGARIGAAYTPPSEAQPPSAEDIALDMLAEHEARLCMLELTTTALPTGSPRRSIRSWPGCLPRPWS